MQWMHSEHSEHSECTIFSEQCECSERSKNDQKIAFSVYCNDITIGLDLVNITNINQ